MEGERSRILDTFYLICAALLVCVIAGGAFLLADIYHVNPLWILFGLISVSFVAGAREDYRKEFRSPLFVAFVIGWVAINVIVIICVLAAFGWLWLIPALLLEQVLFYITASWLFDVPLPSKRRWPFQRSEPADKARE